MSPWFAVRCARCGREKYPTAETRPGPEWVCRLCMVTGGPRKASATQRAALQKANQEKSSRARVRSTGGAGTSPLPAPSPALAARPDSPPASDLGGRGLMADAVPGIQRSARHQLREDVALYAHLLDRKAEDALLRPNLMLLTGPTVRRPPQEEHGTLVPILLIKSG